MSAYFANERPRNAALIRHNGADANDDDEHGAQFFWRNLDRADAVDFVKKSSKSELSLRFLSHSKSENFACHFLANSADRPRI